MESVVEEIREMTETSNNDIIKTPISPPDVKPNLDNISKRQLKKIKKKEKWLERKADKRYIFVI